VTCSFDSVQTLDEWAEQLLAPLNGRRYPLSGSIDLTERCNLGCVHCYINQPAGDAVIRAGELTTDQWKLVLDQIAEAGCLFLLISGGEPLLRPDFSEIFIYARKKGMLVTLFTNGTMLTPELVDMLAKWGLHAMEISLYGATPETYEKVTGQPGSFERCMRGIDLALSRGLKLDIKTVLLTLNRDELEGMKAITTRYGLGFRYDNTLWPRLNGDHSNQVYEISQEEILALDMKDMERNDSWQETVRQFEGHLIRAENVFTCGAGFRSFHVSARGKLVPCMMLRNPSLDILTMGFSTAWEKLGEIRGLKRTQKTECETCDVAALCTQCPGWSQAENGDWETPVTRVCELGRARSACIKLLET
jgi:radical SAM protein with 4Fe4S-binding SPASM domain